MRFPGQYEDLESGLYYNRYRYYDSETAQYICTDPSRLYGGLNQYSYVHNSLSYIDLFGLFGEKPSNSPDPGKWIEKGGTVWTETDGTWVYKNKAGVTVRYPDGYPDFSPHSVQEVDVPDLKGNHGKNPSGDFGKADAKAPNGAADYSKNTWHHHQNGTTMQEVPRDIHNEFTHKGGVSNIKSKTC